MWLLQRELVVHAMVDPQAGPLPLSEQIWPGAQRFCPEHGPHDIVRILQISGGTHPPEPTHCGLQRCVELSQTCPDGQLQPVSMQFSSPVQTFPPSGATPASNPPSAVRAPASGKGPASVIETH